MLLTGLIAVAKRTPPLRVPVLVVVASAVAALVFTLATRPDRQEPPRVAGEARISLMKHEHALVAAYVRADLEAKAAAAANDRAEMRALATAAVPPSGAATVRRAAAKPAAQVAAMAGARGAEPAGPPLQLQPAVAVPQPPPRRPVAQPARAVLAAVERIPDWVRGRVEDAADWAIIGPARTIARWPERRFL